MSLRTEMSPPRAPRTLPVSAVLTMLPTSCSETMAMTPTAIQKMASSGALPAPAERPRRIVPVELEPFHAKHFLCRRKSVMWLPLGAPRSPGRPPDRPRYG